MESSGDRCTFPSIMRNQTDRLRSIYAAAALLFFTSIRLVASVELDREVSGPRYHRPPTPTLTLMAAVPAMALSAEVERQLGRSPFSIALVPTLSPLSAEILLGMRIAPAPWIRGTAFVGAFTTWWEEVATDQLFTEEEGFNVGLSIESTVVAPIHTFASAWIANWIATGSGRIVAYESSWSEFAGSAVSGVAIVRGWHQFVFGTGVNYHPDPGVGIPVSLSWYASPHGRRRSTELAVSADFLQTPIIPMIAFNVLWRWR